MSEHVLQPQHAESLVEYIRFLRRKRDTAVAEVAHEFKECKESRLFEDNYTREDVEALMDGLLAVVRNTMKRDLQSSMHSSVLLLKQQFEQAEKVGIALSTDFAMTEDHSLVDAVATWESGISGSSMAPELRARAAHMAPPRAALPVIGQAQDASLVAELQQTREEIATLQDRFQKLQVQCAGVIKEKGELSAQVASLTSGSEEVAQLTDQIDRLQIELAAAQEATAAAVAPQSGVEALLEELRGAQQTIADLTAELDDAQTELLARLEKSKPFLNLRSMLNKKNLIVRELRETLVANGFALPQEDIAPTEE